jgi:hypothetical protein
MPWGEDPAAVVAVTAPTERRPVIYPDASGVLDVRFPGPALWCLSAAAATTLLVAACRPDECRHEGQSYPLGATFAAADGCNSCSCAGNGKVACTDRTCGAIGSAADAGAGASLDASTLPDGAGEAHAPVPPPRQPGGVIESAPGARPAAPPPHAPAPSSFRSPHLI